jgi:hypothetical protein
MTAPDVRVKRSRTRRPLSDRFMDKVPIGAEPDACWIWQGKPSTRGYGRINAGPDRGYEILLAHRAAYELFVGPIPDGLQIDHRCHSEDPTCTDGDSCPHRMCVNPAHLEAVPPVVNYLRGHGLTVITAVTGVCQRGHDYNEHRYTQPKTGKSQCRECRRWRRANWNAA